MNILKQGKLPKSIYFVCRICGARFTCFATEDCIGAVLKDTDKPVWTCKCPTDGCRNICTADFSEEDVRKWKDNLDIREVDVPELLSSSFIDGSTHNSDYYYIVCPYCDERRTEYAIPYLKRSDRFDGAIVCSNCHRPFKVV